MRQLLMLTMAFLFTPMVASEEAASTLPVRDDISSDFSYERRFVEVDNLKLAYYEAGEGRPILFVHGIATWSYIWRNVMPHLEGMGRVIAVDLPGFGYSDTVRGLTPQREADYLEAFIEKLGLKDIVLVLHDFGAIGLNYAQQHPGNVAGVAFMELPIEEAYSENKPADAIFSKQADDRLLGFISILKDDEKSRSLIVDQNLFAADAVILNGVTRQWSDQEKQAYKAPFADRGRREGLRDLLSNFLLNGQPVHTADTIREQGKWLVQSETPKLAIVAQPGSLMTKDFMRAQTDRISNIQITELGQSRHLIMEDHPHALGLVLRGWVAGL